MSARGRFFRNLNSRVNELIHEQYAGHCPTTKRLTNYINKDRICLECKAEMSEDSFDKDHILAW